jgi:hypothetical protein
MDRRGIGFMDLLRLLYVEKQDSGPQAHLAGGLDVMKRGRRSISPPELCGGDKRVFCHVRVTGG